MGETQGTVHSEGHVFLAMYLGNQTNYVLPEYSGGGGIGKTFSFQKGVIQKREWKKGEMGFQ